MEILDGKVFGKLIVLGFSHKNSRRKTYWLCECSCGVKKAIRSDVLKSKQAISCGCFARYQHLSHGFEGTRFYGIWSNLKNRCLNTKTTDYKRYGGRGIKVLWKSFESFKNDMYESYIEHVKIYGEKNTQIERINNNSNYKKNNCRWATIREQSVNRRSNIFIEYNNETRCLKDWCNLLGLKYIKTYKRIKRGWSIKKTFATP